MMLSALLAQALPAEAVQTVVVAPNGHAVVQVSATDANRFHIEGRRIARVWGAEDRVAIKPDTEAGDFYLTPVPAGANRPLSIFVKDSEGATYSLLVTPAAIPAETIVLRPEGAGSGSGNGSGNDFERVTLRVLRAVANGLTPDGFTREAVNLDIPKWREARLRLRDRLRDGDISVERYTLTNIDKQPMRIEETEFAQRGVFAVAIESHLLAPQAQTTVYVIRHSTDSLGRTP